MQKTELNRNTKTCSSVKDIASRFEKVLKMPHQQLTNAANISEQGMLGNNNKSVEFVEPKENVVKLSNHRTETDSTLENVSIANANVTNILPLKPAIKAWTDFNPNSDVIDKKFHNNVFTEPDCEGLPEKTAVKPILKQEILTSSEPTSELGNANVMMQRPMQPPDYATAMQRLELIRTSTSDVNLAPAEQIQIKSDTPKKKAGPKKTVTFSDEVVLVACAEYDEIDFSSNPLFERVYQQHVESGKGEIPILSSSYNAHAYAINECNLPSTGISSSCNLCHNKQVSPPNTYCTDCEFYLSRFKP